MKLFNSPGRYALAIVTFFLLTIGASLTAANKHEMFEVGLQIKELQTEIHQAYEELRKLNEEGSEQSQEQAQIIMDQIVEMRERLQALQESLEQMKQGDKADESVVKNDDYMRNAEHERRIKQR